MARGTNMTKKEKFLIAEYKNIRLHQQDAVKIRGYFADMDESDSVMHNHLETGENVYKYPKVQYKVIHKHPFIVAFGNGIDSLYPKLMCSGKVTFGGEEYDNPDLQIRLETREIGDCSKTLYYRFLTPWLALNQENYKKYASLEASHEKLLMLEKILVGNILSMCKGFDVRIGQNINAVPDVRSVPVRFKGENMVGFIGQFTANVRLPAFCGIGKGVSRGMGTIVPVREQNIMDG